MALETKQIYEFGPFRLDASERMLWQGDNPVPLTPKVLETLVVLVESHGKLVEKAELMDKIWPDTAVEQGNLTFSISVLRKALGDDRQNGNGFIETVPRRGYRFIANVTVRKPDDARSMQAPEMAEPAAAENPSRPKPLGRRLLVGAGALVVAAGFLYWLVRPQPNPKVVCCAQLTTNFRAKGGRLLTDGVYIYFKQETGNGSAVALVSVGGGQPTLLPTQIDIAELADIDLHRAKILAIGSRPGHTESRPWEIALPSGSARLAADFNVDAACWSPDGERMAFSKGTELYVSGRDGTAPVGIAEMHGLVGDMRWSPDGKIVRFSVHESRSETSELWEVEASAQNLHPLFDRRTNPSRVYDGSWTVDGAWFVFASARDDRHDVWALRERAGLSGMGGREPVQLTRRMMDFSGPAASRDGKQLFVLGDQMHGQLIRYDSARGDFASFLGGIWADSVTFSRDGQRVAYREWPEGSLWRARADGGQPVQLTFPPAHADGASWSPDGTRIAFRLKKPGKPFKIYVTAAEGGEPQELLPEDPEEEGLPTWSADSRKLAFGEVAANFGHATGKETIHICDLDTRRVSLLPGSGGLWTSRWSPDGRYISAVTAYQRQRLMLYDSVTHGWRDLGADYVNNPAWSHDSKYIYYERLPAGGSPAILRVRASDGTCEQVVSLEGLHVNTAGWSGLTPDDSPIVVQDAHLTEIYALDVEWP
jgi:DNA-binding winged helix-turn-helix (wHTH) protein/Tol biopolymer transport system component